MAVEDVNKYSMFLQLSTSKYVKLEKDTLHGTKFIELKQMNASKVSRFLRKGTIQEFSEPLEASSPRDSKGNTFSSGKWKVSLKEPRRITSFSKLVTCCRNTLDSI